MRPVDRGRAIARSVARRRVAGIEQLWHERREQLRSSEVVPITTSIPARAPAACIERARHVTINDRLKGRTPTPSRSVTTVCASTHRRERRPPAPASRRGPGGGPGDGLAWSGDDTLRLAPDWRIARWNRPVADGMPIRTLMLIAPADSPNG
jgi:hypothetical protein